MILIYCIPDCAPCERLHEYCNVHRISARFTTLNPDTLRGELEIKRLGLEGLPFPVVEIDGRRLPPATLNEYAAELSKVR